MNGLTFPLSCVFFLLPVVGLLSGLITVPMLAILSMLCFAYHLQHSSSKDSFTPLFQQNRDLFHISIGWFGWMGITALWSLEPLSSIKHLGSIILLVSLALLCLSIFSTRPDSNLRVIRRFTTLGFIATMFLAGIEMQTNGFVMSAFRTLIDNPPFEASRHMYNRGLCFLAVFSWLVLGLLYQRHTPIYMFFVGVLILSLLLFFESQSAVLGFAAGVAGWACVATFGRHWHIALIMGYGACILLFLLIVFNLSPQMVQSWVPGLPDSFVHRLEIWAFTTEKIMEKPFSGWGFHASRHIPVLPEEMLSEGKHPLPLHPHNNILQLLLETGAVGLLLFFGFFMTLVQTIRKLPYLLHQQAAVASLTAYLAIGATGYGMWQPWWIATFCLTQILTYLLLHDRAIIEQPSEPSQS